MSNLKTVVYQRLEAIASSEKITRTELASISRELLMYVPESKDIDIVNRLLGVLTLMNRKTAILFFTYFLPWTAEKDTDKVFQRFGKMLEGERKIAKRMTRIAEFLNDENNTIWMWAERNVNVEVKQKDFEGLIVRNINKALEGDERTKTEPFTPAQVMQAIMKSSLTLQDMIDALEAQQAEGEEALEEMAQAA